MKASNMVLCALFAAMTAVCAQIAIPLGPVPVSMATLSVLLCGAVMRPGPAAVSMLVYVLMGLAGLPVFSRMTAGPGALLGLTGGYLMGYVPCAWICSRLAGKKSFPALCQAMGAGMLVCYACGTAWLMIMHGLTLSGSLAAGVLPFLPTDVLKVLTAASLARRVEKALRT